MYREILEHNQIAKYGTAQLPEGLRPFAGLEYAVSFMVPLPTPVVKSIENGPTPLYFHHYRTINAYLDRVAMEIVLAMRNTGYDAVYIPASQSLPGNGLYGQLSHKAVACLAGLGSMGMNALFFSKDFGPAVRLSTVVTNMELPQGESCMDGCTQCGACVKNCPSGALFGVPYRQGIRREEMMDAEKCSVFMKKDSRDVGRGAVCGRCVAVCPLCYK
ncbi:4Fe-4S dicluster domain-containing protein [Christensenellaceae bacterium OttesenSCG-928-K19]|nr:4Fe-4S dicluster domain-containing protein [Christensenellaceae bacterium OttesenSCG-928-K19]